MPVEQQPGGVMPAAEKPIVSSDQAQQPGAVAAGTPASDALSLEQALTELEKARKALKDTNAESAGRRKRLEELEAAEQARQAASLTETERQAQAAEALKQQAADLQRQLEVAQREHQERVIRYEVMLKASSMGIIDLDAATKLMDWQDLEFNEDGTPKNIDGVLKKLIKERPYLSRQDGKSSGMGTPAQKQRLPAPEQGQATRRVTPL